MGWAEELLKAAHMLEPPYSEKDKQIMCSVRYYLGMELGIIPRPEKQIDRSADAYAARTMEEVE